MLRPLLQVLFAVVLVIAVNHFWDPSPAPVPDPQTSERQRTLPRTYLSNARIWTFDQEGQLSEIVEASRMEQYPQQDVSNITEPRFYAHSEDDRTWSASAARGQFHHRQERLELRQLVVLEHDQTGARVDTEALDILLKNNTAVSKSPVTITQGENRTTADGMLAILERETIELGPNVESIYVERP